VEPRGRIVVQPSQKERKKRGWLGREGKRTLRQKRNHTEKLATLRKPNCKNQKKGRHHGKREGLKRNCVNLEENNRIRKRYDSVSDKRRNIAKSGKTASRRGTKKKTEQGWHLKGRG